MQEILTDVWKSAMFWRAFGLQSADVRMSRKPADVATGALIIVASFGLVLTGFALATLHDFNLD